MIRELVNWFFGVLEHYVGHYLVIDNWYKIGTGVSIAGYSLNSIFGEVHFLFAADWLNSMITNPVPYVTAAGILMVNVVAVWQKVQSNRRAEERHQQELLQDMERYRRELGEE